jgi:hypothetical protein
MNWYGLKYPKLNQETNNFDMLLKYDDLINLEETPEIKTYKFLDS